MTAKKQNVWQTLSAIDVSKHIEKKGNLSYLSWAWAWGALMDHYPDSDYEIMTPVTHQDGTVTVWVALTVEGKTRRMWLPVMDNRNNAVKEPNARDINDATMRCLVKAIAMFGLGHYIYAGEDLPEAVKEEKKASLAQLRKAIEDAGDRDALLKAWQSVPKEFQAELAPIKDAKKGELAPRQAA